MRNTREMIAEFSRGFERPVNESFQTNLSPADRVLLGNLLLEETVETIVKGLGLDIHVKHIDDYCGSTIEAGLPLGPDRGINPVEIVDGQADVNVVNHFMAHWIGFNLDEATEIVNDSNMSKLGSDGKPIINGVTPGYRTGVGVAMDHLAEHRGAAAKQKMQVEDEPGYDSSKPIGKILKGPNFYDPQSLLAELIAREGGNRG